MVAARRQKTGIKKQLCLTNKRSKRDGYTVEKSFKKHFSLLAQITKYLKKNTIIEIIEIRLSWPVFPVCMEKSVSLRFCLTPKASRMMLMKPFCDGNVLEMSISRHQSSRKQKYSIQLEEKQSGPLLLACYFCCCISPKGVKAPKSLCFLASAQCPIFMLIHPFCWPNK